MGGQEENKSDKFDEMGQLPGGYDVDIARERALNHAKGELPQRKAWLQGLSLEWEILSAKFDEEEDCYKVILECYPDELEIEEKSRWEYHIDATGKLYAGTPRLVSKGKWMVGKPTAPQKNFVEPSVLEMVTIPGGSFQMGDISSGRDSDELPIHPVTLSPFSMAKYVVTYAKWVEVKDWAERNGYSFNTPGNIGSEKDWHSHGNVNETHPVTKITWYDAILWCNAVSEMEGRIPCYYTSSENYRSGKIDIQNNSVNWEANGYRLPTEAEWEYACRANTITIYSFGESIGSSDANYNSNEGGTTPVGRYAPNQWGLFDMHGNVCEWCWDWKGAYSTSSESNPLGPSVGWYRIIRGGSWFFNEESLRSTNRNANHPGDGNPNIGFRPVCVQ